MKLLKLLKQIFNIRKPRSSTGTKGEKFILVLYSIAKIYESLIYLFTFGKFTSDAGSNVIICLVSDDFEKELDELDTWKEIIQYLKTATL